ncbi:helix-turn-helix domain-containing protein [Hyphococcus sp. DH-69]|uniref:helix-turn-helix domain-containing protein n=1 Tax=Hyphococcus formosus TaxID=3143534 RepID=UPI00398B781A
MDIPQNAVKAEPAVQARPSGPHPIDVHVGARVKLRRMILGMSQEALGSALGLTFQQIQKYEKGVNRIGASRMFEIAKLLRVPVQFFYDDYEDEPLVGGGFAEDSDPVMDMVRSPEGVQLCRHFAAIKDQDVKKRVLELVRSIADTANI